MDNLNQYLADLPAGLISNTATLENGDSFTESATENASGNGMGASKYHIFPDLSPTEYEQLKASIQTHGPLMSVIEDDEGNLIDGRHRKRACDELGISCPNIRRSFSSEAEKMEVAAAVNAKRRHLSGRQKRVVIANYLQADQDIADNYLGELLGVSKNTVAAEREKLEAGGQIDELTMLRGKDGKLYPREKRERKPDPNKKSTTKKKPSQPIGDEAEPEVDANGSNDPADTGKPKPHVAATEPEADDDQFDREGATFVAALATIKGLLGDPWDTLSEVIAALGLKMPEVAAWAQQQAEWEEPSEVEATPPAPLVAAEVVESLQEAVGKLDVEGRDEACAPKSVPKEEGDEDSRENGEKGTVKLLPSEQPRAFVGDRVVFKKQIWEVIAQVGDGGIITLKNATGKETNIQSRRRDRNGKERYQILANRPVGEDLASMVVKALTGVDDGLDLPDLTAKVLHLGYQTQSQNLGMAIYNVLGKLKKNGKVVRDDEARKYRLVVTESEVQYEEVAG
jgi:ParB-like chromosome segregation protein Spo0J